MRSPTRPGRCAARARPAVRRGAVVGPPRRRPRAPLTRRTEMPFPCGQAWTGTTRRQPQPEPLRRSTGTGPTTSATRSSRRPPGVVTPRWRRRPAATGGTSWSTTATVSHRCTPTWTRSTSASVRRVDQGSPDRHRRQHRQLHRPAPALRGAAATAVTRSRSSTGAEVRLRQHAGLPQLLATSRVAGNCDRRRQRRGRRSSDRGRRADVPDQPPDRAPVVVAFGLRHRPAGRRRLGRRRHGSTSASARRRPQPSTLRTPDGTVATVVLGERSRPAGRRRLGRRRLSRRSACARPATATSSGCATPTARKAGRARQRGRHAGDRRLER